MGREVRGVETEHVFNVQGGSPLGPVGRAGPQKPTINDGGFHMKIFAVGTECAHVDAGCGKLLENGEGTGTFHADIGQNPDGAPARLGAINKGGNDAVIIQQIDGHIDPAGSVVDLVGQGVQGSRVWGEVARRHWDSK